MVDFTGIIQNVFGNITNPYGLFAFLGLVVLLILYLIKPKPKKN